MKHFSLLFLFFVALSSMTHAQTTVVLQGACTDCSAEITSFINCSVASAGTIQANAVIGPGVTQTIQVSVGKKGKYSFTTTNNGITFSASGTFTSTGTQTVTLTASGVATTSGTTTFTLTQSGQSCTFSRTVGAAVAQIAGPCPSNLKFWRVVESSYPSLHFTYRPSEVMGGAIRSTFSGLHYGITKDSVLYAFPFGFYGVNNSSTATAYGNVYINSPARIQNVPKIICGAELNDNPELSFFVGADGHIYGTIPTGSYIDPSANHSGRNYPYTVVGLAIATDPRFKIVKYPLPPTGSKWTDVTLAPGLAGPDYLFVLNDLGEMYSLEYSTIDYINFNTSTYLQKMPIPLGTDPATFQYKQFHGRGVTGWVMVAGNDGSYYSFTRTTLEANGFNGGRPFSLGWGEVEKTIPMSAHPVNSRPSSSDQIRRVQFPAGTVLADDSRYQTVDGKIYIFGNIAKAISAPGFSGGAYFWAPLKDGDYTYSRPDMSVSTNNVDYISHTPREVALPAGATRFYGRLFPGEAFYNTNNLVGYSSTPLIASTDNGVYGLYPDKVNKYTYANGTSYLELTTARSPSNTDVYVAKYVPSLPSFASYYIPRNMYGLSADGTYYAGLISPVAYNERYTSYPLDRWNFSTVLDIRQLYPTAWPGVSNYALMLNGNCDYNNPHPEPQP